MTTQAERKRTSNPLLGVLLGLAIAGSAVLGQGGIVPAWAGAALSGVGLFGALVVLSRQGALKVRYIILFAGAILAAALVGWLLK
jgi:hypothetical protein